MTAADVVHVSPGGLELDQLVAALPTGGNGRVLLGLVGAPGTGKSTLAARLVEILGDHAAAVPLDGFHLADLELRRRGLLDRKGAPETFDAWGYAAMLRRLRDRPDHVVMAPAFERTLEQPVAGAVPVDPSVDVVVTEGNYLLLDDPAWEAGRRLLDEVWFVRTDDALRTERLVSRHAAFGKTLPEAESWVARVDEPNARLVDASVSHADLVLDLTAWRPA